METYPSALPESLKYFEHSHINFHSMVRQAVEFDSALADEAAKESSELEEMLDECVNGAYQIESGIVEYIDTQVHFEAMEVVASILDEEDPVHSKARPGYFPVDYSRFGKFAGIGYFPNLPVYLGTEVISDNTRPGFVYVVEIDQKRSESEAIDEVVRKQRMLLPVRSTKISIADKELDPDINQFEGDYSIIDKIDAIIEDPWMDPEQRIEEFEQSLATDFTFMEPAKRMAHIAYINQSGLLPDTSAILASRLWKSMPEGYMFDTSGRVFDTQDVYMDWVAIPVKDYEMEETGKIFKPSEEGETIPITKALGLVVEFGGDVKYIMPLKQEFEII